jgi:hypothetical protein
VRRFTEEEAVGDTLRHRYRTDEPDVRLIGLNKATPLSLNDPMRKAVAIYRGVWDVTKGHLTGNGNEMMSIRTPESLHPQSCFSETLLEMLPNQTSRNER